MRVHTECFEFRTNSPHDLLVIGVTRRMDECRISVGNSLGDGVREHSRRIGKTREVRQSLCDDARDCTRLDETAGHIGVDLGSAPTLGRRVKVEACKARVTLRRLRRGDDCAHISRDPKRAPRATLRQQRALDGGELRPRALCERSELPPRRRRKADCEWRNRFLVVRARIEFARFEDRAHADLATFFCVECARERNHTGAPRMKM